MEELSGGSNRFKTRGMLLSRMGGDDDDDDCATLMFLFVFLVTLMFHVFLCDS